MLCKRTFKGKGYIGQTTIFSCTRNTNHSGPCQWKYGQKLKKNGDKDYIKGIYIEGEINNDNENKNNE